MLLQTHDVEPHLPQPQMPQDLASALQSLIERKEIESSGWRDKSLLQSTKGSKNRHDRAFAPDSMC